MLKLENVQGGYTKGCQILKGINLHINSGEVVGIIGMNGCGKSTLGKAVMNMLPFSTGQIIFKGKDISCLSVHQIKKAGIGMVLQGGRVFHNMTVWEHLQFACNKLSRYDINYRVDEIEDKFGFSLFGAGITSNRKAGYLSGGEKQQLVLMMALLVKPDLLILDEISSGLSPKNVTLVTKVLKNLISDRTISVMFIEQNIKLAIQLADRLILLEQGCIKQTIPIDSTFDYSDNV